MIVVADTSPINYLIQIDQIDLLEKLYKEIFVPQAVLNELSHDAAPTAVRTWTLRRPDWVKARAAMARPETEFSRLDKGEQEAIWVALDLCAGTLLIDDLRGREEAKRRGLSVTGTLGVLMLAGKEGLLTETVHIYRRLVTETSFRISPDLEEFFLSYVRSIH